MKYKILQFLLLVFFAGASVSVSACGIKPRQVDPPPGADSGTFPRQYPGQ